MGFSSGSIFGVQKRLISPYFFFFALELPLDADPESDAEGFAPPFTDAFFDADSS